MEQETASLPRDGVLCVMSMCICAVFFKCMSSRAKIIYITICLCHCHLFLIPKQSGFAETNAYKHLCRRWGMWVRFGENVAGLTNDSDLMKTSSPRQTRLKVEKI